ncbi:MAG: DDE-type integrase/transposase/recombinase [Nitrosotalea sp.]
MRKITIETKIRAVLLYIDDVREAKDICAVYDIPARTFRRWISAYRRDGINGLKSKKPGPPKGTNSITIKLGQRIIKLKQKHPSWGARRIKYQYNLSCHWRTVHNVIRRHGMLVRIKPKPHPSKRFQRRNVDSMWQGDTFQFRISGTGKVYVTGFTDDRSRYRIISKAYLNKSRKESINALYHALKKGRIPRQIYLDNGRQFTAKEFKKELAKHHIKPVYGRPYHPRGRGKIERYHSVLWQELVTQVRFSSLSHFRKELRKFDRRYNHWRKNQTLGWKTPASVYNDSRYLNKKRP